MIVHHPAEQNVDHLLQRQQFAVKTHAPGQAYTPAQPRNGINTLRNRFLKNNAERLILRNAEQQRAADNREDRRTAF